MESKEGPISAAMSGRRSMVPKRFTPLKNRLASRRLHAAGHSCPSSSAYRANTSGQQALGSYWTQRDKGREDGREGGRGGKLGGREGEKGREGERGREGGEKERKRARKGRQGRRGERGGKGGRNEGEKKYSAQKSSAVCQRETHTGLHKNIERAHLSAEQL